MALQSFNLKFSYGPGQVFAFPDLDLKKSDTALLLGQSGAGKTTFLHLLSGLLEPSAGKVIIGERNLFALSSKNRDKLRGQEIGIIFQRSFFMPYLNICENLILAHRLHGKKLLKSEVLSALTELNVPHIAYKKPAHCSIGEQQRASIARVILQKPKVILADEPTSALDDENANRVGELLQEVAKKYHSALLIVTHDARLKSIFPKTYLL